MKRLNKGNEECNSCQYAWIAKIMADYSTSVSVTLLVNKGLDGREHIFCRVIKAYG